MLQWHWMHESIRPVDWSRFAHGHDGNPRGSVPFKMSGLEGHRSLQALYYVWSKEFMEAGKRRRMMSHGT